MKHVKSYVLPKRLLKRLLTKLESIKNLDVRSAANALAHCIGQYHAAPGTFGRKFFLCREKMPQLACMEGHSEWHIRLAIDELRRLGFIRKFKSGWRKTVLGMRRAPTTFILPPGVGCFFPEAQRLNASRRYGVSPECNPSSQNLTLSLERSEGVHTGEPDHKPYVAKTSQGAASPLEDALARLMANLRPPEGQGAA